MKLNASGKATGKPHAVLSGVDAALKEISRWPDVDSVVAGRISKVKHRYPTLSVTLQTTTVSGVKCLARIGQAVQELFVVTDKPDTVALRLKARWPSYQ